MGEHKLKITGQELDARLDLVKANETQITENAGKIDATKVALDQNAAADAELKARLDQNTAADAELKARVEAIEIPTKVSVFENDANYITDAALEGYAKKTDIPTISGAASAAEVEALKTQLASLSDFVLENVGDRQEVTEIPEGGLSELNYTTENLIIKGTAEAPLAVNCAVIAKAPTIVMKNIDMTTKNTNVKLTVE